MDPQDSLVIWSHPVGELQAVESPVDDIRFVIPQAVLWSPCACGNMCTCTYTYNVCTCIHMYTKQNSSYYAPPFSDQQAEVFMCYQKFLYLGAGKIVDNYFNSVAGNIFNTQKAP